MRRGRRAVLVGAALLALVACGGPATAPEASPPVSPSPDLRPTQASSQGPARNVPKPELPEAARQNTKEGFEAFTQYWFDTATYSFESGDSASLDAVSANDCKVCNSYISDIDQLRSSQGWASGPSWKISQFSSNMIRDPLAQVVGYFLLEESPSTIFATDGTVAKSRKGGNNGNAKAAFASFESGLWSMRQLGQAP